jgi:bacterioferritin
MMRLEQQCDRKDAVATELNLHATEELSHATLLVTRIVQLGGKPVTDPRQGFALSPYAYNAPGDSDVSTLLGQNIAGEQCAISA